MCDFCPSESEHDSLTYRDITYDFCNDCYGKAKLCDHCGVLGVYGLQITHSHETGFTCASCAGDTKECIKCGASHRGEDALCKSCKKKWFQCLDCGEVKTNARSLISELEYARREHVLPGRHTCQKCHDDKYLHHEPREIKACMHCGNYHSTSEKYCPACMPKTYLCGNCGQRHIGYGQTYNDEKWCSTCSSKLTTCDSCEAVHLKATSTKIGHSQYCSVCISEGCECDKCGRFTKATKIIDDFKFCRACAKSVAPCAICEVEHYDLVDSICPDCRFELGVDSVRNYTTKMPIRLKGKASQPHYGIENEVSVRGSIRVDVGLKYFASRYHGKDVIYKHDASINNGFECVFRPLTYKELCDFKFAWHPKIFQAHDSCGMHIHMNKTSFTTYHLYKFSKFFQDNMDFISRVAQRKPNRYCEANRDQPKYMAKSRETGDRSVINLRGRHTMEVRIFAGVTSEAQFKKNVEFLDALYYFTKNNTTIDAVSVDKFEAWVTTQKYPNLKKFLKEVA